MVKCEVLGMLNIAKVNPVLKSDKDIVNYSFITADEDLYLIANTIVGDDAYLEDVVIPAGEYLNGFLVKAWESQKLVIDAKHITTEYASLVAGTTYLKANEDGKLEVASAHTDAGVYFKVTDKCKLTQDAIKAKIVVVA